MRITESKAKELGMVADGKGNFVAKKYTEFIESQRSGAFRRVAGRSKSSPAQVRADMISNAVAIGMTLDEATNFYEQGHKS